LQYLTIFVSLYRYEAFTRSVVLLNVITATVPLHFLMVSNGIYEWYVDHELMSIYP